MKRQRIALGAMVATAALVLTACGGTVTPDAGTGAAEGGTATVGMKQAWAGFNPYVTDQGNSAGLAIGNAIYPSAFDVQADQTTLLNEDLLESADIVSEDPLTIEYVIQDDAVWSDDTPITADDFIYLWKHLNGSDPDLLITNATGYTNISSVTEGETEKDVIVTFSQPFSEWQSLFSPILPSHFIANLGSDPEAWNTGLIDELPVSGTAFTITENKPEQYLILSRNPKWYGEPAHLDQVTVRFLADDQAAIQALSSGEVNIVLDLKATRALIGQAQAVSSLTTEVVPTTNLMFINTQMNDPVVGLAPVREAIAIAIDPAVLVETLFGPDNEHLIGTHHILAPTSANYQDNRPDGYGSGDLDSAAKVLADAGFTPGDDGILEKDGLRLSTSYMVRADDVVTAQAGVVIQDTLKKLGIELTINTVTSADYFPTLSSGDYGLGLGNMPATAFPVAFYASLYPCDGGYNFANICIEEVDQLFAEAMSTLDPEEQSALVQQIDQTLWADLGNIPMFAVPALPAHSTTLTGIDTLLPKEWMLHDAQNWSIEG